MKKIVNSFLFVLILFGFMAICPMSKAQAPPPPPNEKGTNSNKAPGGGAPIEGGLIVSLALVAGYGAWKFFGRKLLPFTGQ